ncbi:molybdate ABC transporter substrate-binding protein [Microbulbifer mangrovi]|uniref:molybdate ABC transporter substrate-binding protein n=1 Tax=Microbulbifer mangrovi TaxID=927787 RepID=UPI001EFA6F44|nr:molybdate ABC transporter substrate-binding protein [Microbulbifer mangrovi]
MKTRGVALLTSLTAALAATTVVADEVTIAVASNFTAPMQAIAARYEASSNHKIRLAFGSSGKIYAQIRHGAPFDAFFSADKEKPAHLINQGLAEKDSRITYAEGKLVLWSTHSDLVDDSGAILKTTRFNILALANPKLAPYGAAAQQVLQNIRLDADTRSRWVQGENISQTYQFVASGNADLGFVALSQVMRDGEIVEGSAWIVPQSLYSPIQQDAVILKRAADKPALAEFWAFIQGPEARAIMAAYGYSAAQGKHSHAE